MYLQTSRLHYTLRCSDCLFQKAISFKNNIYNQARRQDYLDELEFDILHPFLKNKHSISTIPNEFFRIIRVWIMFVQKFYNMKSAFVYTNNYNILNILLQCYIYYL